MGEIGEVLWNGSGTSQVVLTKANNETITLRVGDFITYRGRPDGVRIEGFTGNINDEGPMGMEYLPWRKSTQKWAELLWSLRGNVRHIIAFPCGMQHYGEQIEWLSVEHLNGGICPKALDVPLPDASQVPQ